MTQKIHVTLNAAYKDGSALVDGYETRAQVLLRDIPTVSTYQEISLRLVVPRKQAEELYQGIVEGNVDIWISNVPSISERMR